MGIAVARVSLCWQGLVTLTRIWTFSLGFFVAVFTSSCLVQWLGDSLDVLPDLGSTNSPASSSHSHSIHVALVASCMLDLEITTVHPLYEYGLLSRFPPGRDGANCLHGGCSAVIVYVPTLIHNKCKLTRSSFTESWGPSGPIAVTPGSSLEQVFHTGDPLELSPATMLASQCALKFLFSGHHWVVFSWWLCLQKETK